MLDYLKLDDIDLHDYESVSGARAVARVEGLIGLAQPKGSSADRSEAHGVWFNPSRFMGAKLITVEGECWGNDVPDAFDEFDVLTEAIYSTLKEGPKALKWRRAGGGLELQRIVKLASPCEPVLEESAAVLKYQVQFEADDPRAYSQTLRSVVGASLAAGAGGLLFPFKFPFKFTQSAGGAAVVVNDGMIETPAIIRVYGPVTSPSVVLVTTGEQVKIDGTIASGDHLEIDTRNRTLKLNGAARRMNMLDTINSTFFDIPRGTHSVRLIALNYGAGAHIEVDTRDAYGG